MEPGLTWTTEFPETGPVDLVVQTRGVASLDGLDAWTRAVVADERRRPGMRVLIDHRALDWSRFGRADVFRRVDAVLAVLDESEVAAVAVVLGSPLAYGLQRMMQAYTLEAAERAGIRFGAFFAVDDAVAWLERSPVAEPTAPIV